VKCYIVVRDFHVAPRVWVVRDHDRGVERRLAAQPPVAEDADQRADDVEDEAQEH
jgi:hypothetical protein